MALCDLNLNRSQKTLIGGRVINPITKEDARKGDLAFAKRESFYDIVIDTTVTTAVVS